MGNLVKFFAFWSFFKEFYIWSPWETIAEMDPNHGARDVAPSCATSGPPCGGQIWLKITTPKDKAAFYFYTTHARSRHGANDLGAVLTYHDASSFGAVSTTIHTKN
jgi:hypothetical protein